MKRRHFIQFAGSTLATLGISQANFFHRVQRYGSAMAQPTSRKLALLVGINRYPDINANLRGCVTDVHLQHELLVHRYGFNPADIVKLSDVEGPGYQPTRDNILSAFQEHLIQQAQSGDVVVFHFSGHGSRVFDTDAIYEDDYVGTMVPNDPLPAPGPNGETYVPDITGRSLFLLMRSLKTNNVTTVLDSCHSGGGLRGNAVVRAIGDVADSNRLAMPAEQALQASLLANLGLSETDFSTARRAGAAKGLGIGSVQHNQLALDTVVGNGNGRVATGAFSYLLTRYLWQHPGAATAQASYIDLKRASRAVGSDIGDLNTIPEFQSPPDQDSLQQPIYFTMPSSGYAAAVLTNTDDPQNARIWLGGISPSALGRATDAVRYTILNQRREAIGEFEQVSRNGLVGFGRILSESAQVAPGMLLRKTSVTVPTGLSVQLGVDDSLSAESSAVESALQQTLVSRTTGEQQITLTLVNGTSGLDCIVSRLTNDSRQRFEEQGDRQLPPTGAILLLDAKGQPMAETAGDTDESATAAIERLTPLFKGMLVRKALDKIKSPTVELNELPLSGEIFSIETPGRSIPLGAQAIGAVVDGALAQNNTLPAGPIRFKVKNNHDSSLYISHIVIEPNGNVIVMFPYDYQAPDDAIRLAADQEMFIPSPEDIVNNPRMYNLVVDGEGRSAFVEVLTLVSDRPLSGMIKGLREFAIEQEGTRGSQPGPLPNSQESGLLENLLSDIAGVADNASTNAEVNVSYRGSRNNSGSGTISVISTLIEIVNA